MFARHIAPLLLIILSSLAASSAGFAQSNRALTLYGALERALATNPRIYAADRDIAAASGRKLQASALPNPEVSIEVDNVFGTGPYRGTRAADYSLQLSQLIEIGGKRSARIAVGAAELDVVRWQREATRLEVLSDTAVAFFSVLAAQRRIAIYDVQIAALERLEPLLKRRVDSGASSPADVARAQIAAALVRADREKARATLAIARLELATLMGTTIPDFAQVVGDLGRIGQPPPFIALLRALESNPQLARFSALRAQRDAELLVARLKPIPDLRAGIAWRHFSDTKDDAVRLGLSMPIPLWDQNRGNITEASELRAKVEAESAIARNTLTLMLGRAYATLTSSAREVQVLRASAIPNIKQAVEAVEAGYEQGRFTLLELLDIQSSATQAAIRELEALLNFHISLATIEGLTGAGYRLNAQKSQ